MPRTACSIRLAEIGIIPKEAAKAIWEKGRNAKFDVERIEAIERVTKHDVAIDRVLRTRLWAHEFIGPDARFVHQGMTSSDVLDTCLAVQLKRASNILRAPMTTPLLSGASSADAFESLTRQDDARPSSRSHGIHAEPTTFGLKLAFAYCLSFSRARAIIAARDEI